MDAKDPFAKALRELYSRSEFFVSWMDCIVEITGNEVVEAYYAKRGDQDGKSRQHLHLWRDAPKLFEQFVRYAFDINRELNYVEVCKKSCNTGYFCDLGFAPGGMSRLLLDETEMKGCGITLEQEKGGNTWQRELESDPRFKSIFGDLLNFDFESLPIVLGDPNFKGFDFMIIGITVHSESDNKSTFKHTLLLAQLAFCLRWLKPSGILLTRCYLSLELIDFHYCMLLHSVFKAPIKTRKPLTEFAKRHTYWALVTDYDQDMGLNFYDSLQRGLKSQTPVYSLNDNELCNICMFPDTSIESLSILFPFATRFFEPAWIVQQETLQEFMKGKKDQICHFGTTCRSRSQCNFGHCKAEVVQRIWNANIEVNQLYEEWKNGKLNHKQ